jgi:hypothetical protein
MFGVTGCVYAQFFQQLGEPELGSFWCAAPTSTSPTNSRRVELHRTRFDGGYFGDVVVRYSPGPE